MKGTSMLMLYLGCYLMAAALASVSYVILMTKTYRVTWDSKRQDKRAPLFYRIQEAKKAVSIGGHLIH